MLLLYRQNGRLCVKRRPTGDEERVPSSAGGLGVPYSQLSAEEKAELTADTRAELREAEDVEV
ncbi:putative ATPase [Paraburkholderia sp. RAU6.4a]